MNVLAEGKYIRLIDDDSWEYIERKRGRGVVAIAALTPDHKVLLVEQYRASMKASVLELPAGLVGDEADAHEDYARAARRELLEETGYEAQEMIWLTQGPSSTGLTNEIIDYFEARGLTKINQGGGVGGENIKVHEAPLATIDQWLMDQMQQGMVVDPRIYIGLYFLNKRQAR